MNFPRRAPRTYLPRTPPRYTCGLWSLFHSIAAAPERALAPADGRASISNQGAEALMYRDCMVDSLDYGEMWTEVSGIPEDAQDAEGVDDLAWTTEYSWNIPPVQSELSWGTGPDGQKCDPCIIVPEAGEEDPLPDVRPLQGRGARPV